jgi:hypothetical protein
MSLIGFFCFDVHIVILVNELQIFYTTYLGNRLCNVPRYLLVGNIYVPKEHVDT